MAMSFSVTTLTAPKTTLEETRYSSFEDAITGAEFMLGDGAVSVWIVDRIAQTGWIASSQPEVGIDWNWASSHTIRLQSASRRSKPDLNM